MYIRLIDNSTLTLCAESNRSIRDIKSEVEDATGFLVDEQRLLFSGSG